MGEAFLWGAVGASALVVGAWLAYAFDLDRRVIATIMALGSGLLIGAVSFELVEEAISASSIGLVAIFVLVGAGMFTVGDWALGCRGGHGRKDATGGSQAEGSALAIVLGSVLDGIPESFVLGLTVLSGKVSISLLVGILLSNLPEGMSSSAGLRVAGWSRGKTMLMWSLVVLASAISAATGYFVLADPDLGGVAAAAQGIAAGGLLAMVADTLLPEAYAVDKAFTGSLVAAGFAISLGLQAF